MTAPAPDFDAVVVGGGFYGVSVAVYLATRRALPKVLLVEDGSTLCSRASYNNQARVHNGYHYPRSFTTAFRSRVNLPAFSRDWPQAVYKDFAALYAIARRNSKTTARQFERFCREIGARLKPAAPTHRALFDERLVEAVYEVQEYAFDATALADWAERALQAAGVTVHTETRAARIERAAPAGLTVGLSSSRTHSTVGTRLVFNCTYSRLNQLGGEFPRVSTGLKHEITEMALVRMPPALAGLGVTVMDGPFFSAMPFPPRGLHTLSHVRYTPHLHWPDAEGVDPGERLEHYPRRSRADRMIRDAARYLPSLASAVQVDSLFEVKTVLVRSEGDDGRPILFEKHASLPGAYSILGGKIDNIYDVLERLDGEPLEARTPWETA